MVGGKKAGDVKTAQGFTLLNVYNAGRILNLNSTTSFTFPAKWVSILLDLTRYGSDESTR